MQYRRLGKTGLEVSVLGLGSGGPNQLGQLRSVPKQQVIALVRRALELGINFFDTASGYESEAVLAEGLAGTRRDRFLLASKIKPMSGGAVLAPGQARALVERSLSRCRVSELDLLQLHRVEPQYYEAVRDSLVPELERLKQEGKIRYLGITESSRRDPEHRMLKMALRDDLFETVMVSYSPYNPLAEEKVFPMALERGTGVIAMAVARDFVPDGLASRLGRFTRSMRHSMGSLSRPRAFVRQCRGAVSLLAKSPARLPPDLQGAMPGLAYSFAASPGAVACVLSGTVSPAHLEENVAAVLAAPVTEAMHDRLVRHARPRR